VLQLRPDNDLFIHAALPSNLDANQFGSPAILDANQFESVVASADRQNRISQRGFHRARNSWFEWRGL